MIRKIIKGILVLLLFFFIWLGFSLSPSLYFNYQNESMNSAISITGHRGAAAVAPENTLSSIKEALKLDVDRIEIDLGLTKDNVVVLLHDKTLNRTTNGKGNLKDYSYQELLKIQANKGFEEAFPGEKIPTLKEVLELVDGQKKMIIEIKYGDDYYPEIEAKSLELIEEMGAMDWCVFHSFSDKVLEKLHEISPEIELHKLFFGKVAFIPLYIDFGFNWTNLDKYSYCTEFGIHHLFLTKNMIKKVHAKEKKINVWTVNSVKKAANLVGMGVDGIITDDPKLILESLK